MFFGTYRATLDDKNRLRIPFKLRTKMIGSFMIGTGTGKSLIVMQSSAMEDFLGSMENVPYSDLKEQDFVRLVASRLNEPTEDDQGRFILPAELKRHANIIKNIVIIGAVNRIEIWAEEEFDERFGGNANIDEAVKGLSSYGL